MKSNGEQMLPPPNSEAGVSGSTQLAPNLSKSASQNKSLEMSKAQVYQQSAGINIQQGEKDMMRDHPHQNNKFQQNQQIIDLRPGEDGRMSQEDKEKNALLGNNDIDKCPKPCIKKSNCTMKGLYLSLFFTLLIIGGIILIIMTEQAWLLILGIIFYYTECLCSSKFSEVIDETIQEQSFFQMYQESTHDDFMITFKTTAYHQVVKLKDKKKQQNLTVQQIEALQSFNSQKKEQMNANNILHPPQPALPPPAPPANTHAPNNAALPPLNHNNHSQPPPQVISAQEQQQKLLEAKKQELQKFIQAIKPSQIQEVREIVYSEQRSFDYNKSIDFSNENSSLLSFFKNYSLLKMHIIILWQCGNSETLEAYKSTQQEILNNAKFRSMDIENTEITQSYSLPNISLVRSKQNPPFFYSKASYIIFSLIFLSFPLRLFYQNSYKCVNVYLQKQVFV